MAKKKKKGGGGDIPEWVVTYGDLMSLLLCFFILLSAFSELKKPREYQKVMESVKEALGVSGGVGRINFPATPTNTNMNRAKKKARSMPGEQPSVSDTNRDNVTGPNANVSKIHEGTRFTVGGQILFSPGSFDLSQQNRDKLMLEVAPKIRDLNDVVVIRGHAWGEPDLKAGFSLRELSYKRAEAVFDYLVYEAGVREMILRIESVGSAEPRRVERGSSEADPENRRVEIFRTEASVDEMHPDPAGTGRSR